MPARQQRWREKGYEAHIRRMIAKHRAELEHLAGLPLGEVYGCGHFGCVAASTPPWVVKVTADVHEPAMWAQIERMILEFAPPDEAKKFAAGICRIHKLGLLVRGKARGDYREVGVIAREEATPLFFDDERQATSRGRSPAFPATPYTYEKLNVPEALRGNLSWVNVLENEPDWPAYRNMLQQRYGASEEDADTMTNNLWAFWGGVRLISYIRKIESLQRQRFVSYEQATNESLRTVLSVPDTWITQGVARLLAGLLQSGTLLRDLHMLNIGWRVHSHVDGDQIYVPAHGAETEEDAAARWAAQGKTVANVFGGELDVGWCIYDPGFTPTDWEPKLEKLMVQNVRRGMKFSEMMPESYERDLEFYGRPSWRG